MKISLRGRKASTVNIIFTVGARQRCIDRTMGRIEVKRSNNNNTTTLLTNSAILSELKWMSYSESILSLIPSSLPKLLPGSCDTRGSHSKHNDVLKLYSSYLKDVVVKYRIFGDGFPGEGFPASVLSCNGKMQICDTLRYQYARRR